MAAVAGDDVFDPPPEKLPLSCTAKVKLVEPDVLAAGVNTTLPVAMSEASTAWPCATATLLSVMVPPPGNETNTTACNAFKSLGSENGKSVSAKTWGVFSTVLIVTLPVAGG